MKQLLSTVTVAAAMALATVSGAQAAAITYVYEEELSFAGALTTSGSHAQEIADANSAVLGVTVDPIGKIDIEEDEYTAFDDQGIFASFGGLTVSCIGDCTTFDWSFTPDGLDLEWSIVKIAVKASDWTAIFLVDPEAEDGIIGATGGQFSTGDFPGIEEWHNVQSNAQGVSNVSFFGTQLAVPEPATMGTLGLGLTVLAFGARRRRKKA